MRWIDQIGPYLVSHLLYDPEKPLLFTQGFFWVFFLFVLFVYSFVYWQKTMRNTWLLLVSLYFYYKCAGVLVGLLVFSIIATYLIGIGMGFSRRLWQKKLLVAISLVVSLGLLSYFKYTYFFIDIWNRAFHSQVKVIDYLALWSNRHAATHFNVSLIVLPVGISFFTFQALSYIIDLYRGKVQPVRNIIDLGFYKAFFPQLVAGPIVRAAEFVPQIYAKYNLTSQEMGHAVFLIMNGLVKKMVISDYLSINFVDRVFDNPLTYSGFENLMAVYGYTLQIYCDFSGYTDIAIGLALLLGFRLPINFNSPYKATNLVDFWRRWHISLSTWLRDYLYIPLGGNRKGEIRAGLNIFITMLLGGLWHGANWRFLIWGGLHGVGILFNKAGQKLFSGIRPGSRWLTFLSVFFTFHFVAFAWIFFRAANVSVAFQVLCQIVGSWDATVLPAMFRAYFDILFILALGFSIHYLPASCKEKYRGIFISSPSFVKIVVAVLVILFIFQLQGAALKPFIYFQF